MASSLGALRSASFAMLASASYGSRTHFPVNANQYVYSQFEHVAGTPVDDGSGIPLAKLKILNTIIDQLIAMKKTAAVDLSGESLEFLSEGAAEKEIAPMIESYQREVQVMAESLQDTFYKPPAPEAGLLFNFGA